MTLQKTVDEWTFSYTNVSFISNCSPPSTVLIPFPTYEYNQNPFYNRVGFLLGLAMVMSTMYPLSRLVKSVVKEKETRLREVMKIMGLRDWAHQLSWFLSAFVLFFWIAISFLFVTQRYTTSSCPTTYSRVLSCNFTQNYCIPILYIHTHTTHAPGTTYTPMLNTHYTHTTHMHTIYYIYTSPYLHTTYSPHTTVYIHRTLYTRHQIHTLPH